MLRMMARGAATCLAVWTVTAMAIYVAARHPRLDSLWVLALVVLGGYLAATQAVVTECASDTTNREDTK